MLFLPANFDQPAADDLSARLRQKVREAVNAGLDGLVLDLSQLKAADMTLIKLGLQVTQLCAELGIRSGLVGSEALCLECSHYEETKDWRFSGSFEQAAAALKGTTLA